MSLVITAAPSEDDDRSASRGVYGPMFLRMKFNIHLCEIGFCKTYIKDMNQAQYDDYVQLLWMLEQMSLNEKPI